MKTLRARGGLGSSQTGAALPLALLALLMLSALGFTLVMLGTTEVTVATNWRAYNTAFYGAEAGTESGVVGLRTLLAQKPNPTPADLATITAPTLSDPTLTFNAYSVTWANTPPPGSYQTTFTSGPYQGVFGIVTDYRITSQVTRAGGTRANLTQIVKYVQVPLFQFGVFYGQGVDLEIAPGPAMTFNGKIFSNSNIYIGAGSSLQVLSTMATAGNIYRRLKRDSAITWGSNPQIADASGTLQTLNFDHDYQPGFTSRWASPTDWMNQALSTFGGQVKDSTMGVTQITPPMPGLFNNPSNPDVVAHQMIELPQPSDSPQLQAAKLYSQAGLRIVDGVATNQSGGLVVLPPGVLTLQTFFDARENKTMTVTQVDIGQLSASGLAPANGVLYVASSAAPTVATEPGVRLVNGAALPSQGLTVVSQNPVYIQGDYNIAPSGPNGNHPPAAVMADAITVLSNNWGPNASDSLGTQPGSARPATSTTVNAGFALGPSAESVLGAGNGQLENDIRFLENWSGQTFTYSGSLVDLWHSQQATGAWSCCVYYSPPIRNWSFDTLFNTNPPPGTPSGVIMLKGPWSQS